ncbi:MAG: DUF2339 domain-containing protein [Gammaproteobacteria bacterium]|nr:DUF2339 domain-containing protein [Gammaproteobacteria bacterium]
MGFGIILAAVFALLGAMAGGFGGIFWGGIVGFFIGLVIDVSRRVKLLEHKLARLSAPSIKPSATSTVSPPTPIPPVHVETPRPPNNAVTPQQKAITPPAAPVLTPPARYSPSPAVRQQPDGPDIFDRLLQPIKHFFTDGNVFAKVGIIVLFFGVGFLVKYAAERHYFPVEVRYLFAAGLGIALLVLGWRMRQRNTVFGLLLQGGGVGVLYLAVFAAAKVSQLLPPGLALGVMIAMVVFSGMSAVLQDAKYLAFFAAAGGFLAPILTSTGGGSHVMLFSYYALLNVGVVGIAWYRAWRELNLLGFVFTFGIGLLWGSKYYQPELLVSVEPFLILFFLFFVSIAVLFALRQPPRLKGYVDGTLVFGVPVISFALQSAVIKNVEFGIALSALSMGGFYITLALLLWRRSAQGLSLLTEAFLALGVVFATLAIPLALDGHWTSAAWALEGAGIVWIGVKQQRLMARLFGLLLQVGSGVAYFSAVLRFDSMVLFVQSPATELVIFNSTFLGAVLISLAGMFASFYLYKHRSQLYEAEAAADIFLLVWGLSWWLGAGYRELFNALEHYAVFMYFTAGWLLFISGSVLILQQLERAVSWRLLRFPVLGFIACMYLSLLLSVVTQQQHPFQHLGVVAWPVAFIVQYFVLRQYRHSVIEWVLKWQHILSLWLLVIIVSWQATWIMQTLVSGATWPLVMWLVIPSFLLSLLFILRPRLVWPLQQHYPWYVVQAGLPMVSLLWLFATAISVFQPGDPWPLEVFIPILNPLELAVIFFMLVLIRWHRELHSVDSGEQYKTITAWIGPALAVTGFALINGMVARSVHHWLGVGFYPHALASSVEFQTSLTVVWTLSGLFITFAATRLPRRVLWFIGAGLLVLVVAKLFFVDLANSGTLARIISFISVGVLFLLINYLSPLPPRQAEVRS